MLFAQVNVLQHSLLHAMNPDPHTSLQVVVEDDRVIRKHWQMGSLKLWTIDNSASAWRGAARERARAVSRE